MNINEIKGIIAEFLKEQQDVITAMYQAITYLETSKAVNLTDVLTAIRSLKGVTVVTMIEPHVAVSDEKHKALVSIKFIPTEGIPLKNFLHSLRKSAINIPGVYSLKVNKVQPMKRR